MKLLVITDESGKVVGTAKRTVEMKTGDRIEFDEVLPEPGHTIHEVDAPDPESLSPDELHKAVQKLIH